MSRFPIEARLSRNCLSIYALQLRLKVIKEDIHCSIVIGDEGPPLFFPIDYELEPWGLNAPCGCLGKTYLAGEYRADLIPLKTIYGTTCLLRGNEIHIDFTTIVESLRNSLSCNLMEHHPVTRTCRLEIIVKMPCDRLPFPILITCEDELIGTLKLLPHLRKKLLLLIAHLIFEFITVIDHYPVNAFLRLYGKILYMTKTCHDRAIGA